MRALGKRFTLLNLFGATTDTITEVAKKSGLPLEVVTLTDPDVREIYQRRFVLVCPDGHLAWRGDVIPYDPTQIIDQVRGAC
jgi:hypothetical protein